MSPIPSPIQPRPSGRGSTGSRHGITLLEMMIVVTLIALLASLTFPSVASGLDSLRLRSASDSILTLLDTAADRAERRQQAVEIVVSPKENSITARSADLGFVRRVDLGNSIHITGVTPGSAAPDANRQFIIYPGGTVPAVGIVITTAEGHRRTVSIDPITGLAQSEIAK
jgi:prepilin-type N-terminal cleavage/methylation domain-containing protein